MPLARVSQGTFDTFALPASGGAPLFQADGQSNPWTGGCRKRELESRPLLMSYFEKDHSPVCYCERVVLQQNKNPGVNRILIDPDRGHALTIDRGLARSPSTALTFLKLFSYTLRPRGIRTNDVISLKNLVLRRSPWANSQFLASRSRPDGICAAFSQSASGRDPARPA